ncbi:MAG: DUF3488 and transglutaminase-like domain-containing protein [Burkholderiaceae bacterium]
MLKQKLAGLPRDSRDTLFLLAVVGWIVLPQAGRLPLWCTALTAGVLAWRGWLALRAKPLPGRWWILALLALTIGATLATHRSLLGRDSGVTLIVVLLALKTLELRARRDAFVIFFLGFFTMLTNFFFSQSLVTAGAMLVGLLGLLTALVNAHMPVGKPPLWHAARTAGTMALLGAPIMAALFVLFPRMGPLWGIPGDAMSGRSGLSSTMQVGNIAQLALDDSIAMRVKFEGAVPQQQDLYFRGPVLSTLDGREWRPLQSTFSARFGVPAELAVFGAPVNYEVTLEPNNRPWIFLLEAAAVPPKTSGFNTVMTADLQWVANRAITDIVRYSAQSHVDFRHGPQRMVASLADYVTLPAGSNPRTAALAREMLEANPGASREQVVQAVLERLRSGGYTYTLEPGTYGEQTADEFWFDRKEGFCEHIASAFVVLMRHMNIPSRIVTGYQGGERNAVDGYWTIRQSDAHAWTEIWVEGRGWRRVDPTSAVMPGRTGAFQRLRAPQGVFTTAMVTVSPGLADSLRNAWEAVNNSWNQWILNYTQSRQLDLLKNIGFESPSWEDLSYVLLALLVGAATCGAAWTLWDRVRQDPWLRLLGRARRELDRAGLALPANAPPREMARALRGRFGEAAQPASAWLIRLEELRYSPRTALTLGKLQGEFRQLAWPRQ